MMRSRLLTALLVTAGLSLAACGGGSSSGSTSSGGSAGSSTGSSQGAAVNASDKNFCDTFASAKDRFSSTSGLPTGDDIKKIKDFANDLEKTAPSSIKSDASVLADYFRFIADAASKAKGGDLTAEPSNLPSELSKVEPAITNVATWAETHCASSSSPSESEPSSAASTSEPSSVPSFSAPSISVPSSLPSFSIPSTPAFSASTLAS
jgi:hypothetical protein